MYIYIYSSDQVSAMHPPLLQINLGKKERKKRKKKKKPVEKKCVTILFSLYTRQLADLIDKFCIDYHFFADDSELYSCLPTEPESALSALRNVESCCRQTKIWMTKNKLKLNEQKTEVLLCGPSSRRETVPVDCLSVGEVSIPFSNVVKTLAVTLDLQ